MKRTFAVGDHVEWNSEAGRVRGTIRKKISAEIKFKGYTVHASKSDPQYLIKGDSASCIDDLAQDAQEMFDPPVAVAQQSQRLVKSMFRSGSE